MPWAKHWVGVTMTLPSNFGTISAVPLYTISTR